MPLVINSNMGATAASLNLSHANDALRKSLARLSSGKRISSPADDAGGLAVSYKLHSKSLRAEKVMQNLQNAMSYMQMQDSGLQTVGKILDRMSALRTMAQDITKNTSDVESYSKEFLELQGQLNQIVNETFNGISLYASGTSYDVANDPTMNKTTGALVTIGTNFDKYGRTLYTHPDGQANAGSISVNVVNLEYVLQIGNLDDTQASYWGGTTGASGVNLGNLESDQSAGKGINSAGFIQSIMAVSIAQFTAAIERLADVRAENGAEQNRAQATYELLSSGLVNMEAAYGRMMDADIALESTRFARHNVLVQASAAMTAQANQLSNVALALFA